MSGMVRVLSADIGLKHDHTAILVAEFEPIKDDLPEVYIRVCERVPQGVSSPELAGILALITQQVNPSFCVGDLGGMGLPIIQMWRKELKTLKDRTKVFGVITTGSENKSHHRKDEWTVPKNLLIGKAILLTEKKKIHIDPGVKEANNLLKELADLKYAFSKTGKLVFGNDLPGIKATSQFDDLATSFCFLSYAILEGPIKRGGMSLQHPSLSGRSILDFGGREDFHPGTAEKAIDGATAQAARDAKMRQIGMERGRRGYASLYSADLGGGSSRSDIEDGWPDTIDGRYRGY